MFLQVSVCPQGGLPQCMLGYPPRPRRPPLCQGDPPAKETPCQGDPPGTEHAGRYGQCVGGMHPTGMQSCCQYCWLIRVSLFIELGGP